MTTELTALSDEQVDRLSTWLDEHAINHMGMNLEALDGYMTALVLSPEPVPFEEWEPVIWGENAANVDAGIRRQAQDLLMLHLDSVRERVAHDAESIPEELTPLMWLPEEEDFNNAEADSIEAGGDWARGFFTGVGLRESQWDAWLESYDFVEEIFLYMDQLESGEVMDMDNPVAAGTPVSFKERMEIIAALPTMLRDLAQLRDKEAAAKVLQ